MRKLNKDSVSDRKDNFKRYWRYCGSSSWMTGLSWASKWLVVLFIDSRHPCPVLDLREKTFCLFSCLASCRNLVVFLYLVLYDSYYYFMRLYWLNITDLKAWNLKSLQNVKFIFIWYWGLNPDPQSW